MIICSVIVPHYNQTGHLRRCLSALSDQSIETPEYEVIVIDNGSKEDVHKLVSDHGFAYYSLRHIQNPYACRNLGISKSKGHVIAFLDAKCTPDHHWIENGLKAVSKADIIGGHYEIAVNEKSISKKIFPLMYLNNQKNIEWGLGVSTGNLFVKREVFDQFGLFDMESVSGNDILFTEKAIKSGYTLAYGPDVIVSYPAKSFKELKKDVFKYGVGAFMTNQKRLGHSLRFLLPMTFRNFQGAVRFRNFNLTLSEYFIAWILVWRIKFQFALGILSGAMKK